MRLYELFAEPGFHTSISTTFCIDFDAYENIALARLRGGGCRNNIVVADRAMLALALSDGSPLPRHAGRLYTVTGASARSVFHPKIVLQLGRQKGRMIVSSANLTASGMAGNLEVGGIIECDGLPSGEADLICAGWTYVRRFLDSEGGALKRQIEWMEARTPWLEVKPLSSPTLLHDKTLASLMTTGNTQGIAAQFAAIIGAQPIERLICMSPFWDDQLEALRTLQDSLQPRETIVLLDNGRHLFPIEALATARPFSLREYKGADTTRFVHAKVFIAQTQNHDHVLFGSANCTVSAMGTMEFAGHNEEASLYRALPPGAAINALSLESTLEAPPLPPENIIAISREEELPHGDLASRHPGRFECLYDTLTWWPTTTFDQATSIIELLAADTTLLSITPKRIDAEDASVRYRISGVRQRLAFARVRSPDGSVSAMSVVTVLDSLREEIRDPRTRRLEIAIEEMDDETEVGLWLLETLNTIEAAEIAIKAQQSQVARRPGRPNTSDDDETESPRVLSYGDFIAGRRLRSDAPGLSPSSFPGSDIARVRGFLNRILSMDGDKVSMVEDEEGDPGAFDLGDESADGAASVEDGFEADSTKAKNPERPQPTQQQLRAARRRNDRHDLAVAVTDLQQDVREKSAEARLAAVDLLRLRAMLTILAAAGWDGRGQATSQWQVLPPIGDKEATWPRLMGKTLSAYFIGKLPPIQTLCLDAEFERIPEDILECWGACLWAANAVCVAAQKYREPQTYQAIAARLRDTVYAAVRLQSQELASPAITAMMDAMNNRFAVRLGVSPDEIGKAHVKASVGRI